MYKRQLLSPATFVGLANIKRAFTDELALKALANSAIYTLSLIHISEPTRPY